jgi:hypothetical protein
MRAERAVLVIVPWFVVSLEALALMKVTYMMMSKQLVSAVVSIRINSK